MIQRPGKYLNTLMNQQITKREEKEKSSLKNVNYTAQVRIKFNQFPSLYSIKKIFKGRFNLIFLPDILVFRIYFVLLDTCIIFL